MCLIFVAFGEEGDRKFVHVNRESLADYLLILLFSPVINKYRFAHWAMMMLSLPVNLRGWLMHFPQKLQQVLLYYL